MGDFQRLVIVLVLEEHSIKAVQNSLSLYIERADQVEKADNLYYQSYSGLQNLVNMSLK